MRAQYANMSQLRASDSMVRRHYCSLFPDDARPGHPEKQSDTRDRPVIDAAHRGGATLSHNPVHASAKARCVHWPARAGAARAPLSFSSCLLGPRVLGCPFARPCTASLRTISPLPRRRSHVCAARDTSSLQPHRLAWRPLMQGCAGGQGRARGRQGWRHQARAIWHEAGNAECAQVLSPGVLRATRQLTVDAHRLVDRKEAQDVEHGVRGNRIGCVILSLFCFCAQGLQKGRTALLGLGGSLGRAWGKAASTCRRGCCHGNPRYLPRDTRPRKACGCTRGPCLLPPCCPPRACQRTHPLCC